MPYVSKRQLDKVYARWNVTFPNQLANEMEVLVTDENNRRHNQLMRQKHKRKIHATENPPSSQSGPEKQPMAVGG